jgi:hypothetical protein
MGKRRSSDIILLQGNNETMVNSFSKLLMTFLFVVVPCERDHNVLGLLLVAKLTFTVVMKMAESILRMEF